MTANHPLFHSYKHERVICIGGQYCTQEMAMRLFDQGLRYHPAPGMDGLRQVYTGFEADAVLIPGIFNLGPVRFYVNRSHMVVRNETLPGHALHPGWAKRQVIFENGKMILRTTGQGIGPLPRLNERLANQVWGTTNAEVFMRMAGVR